jgi:hypothetical protein
MDIFGIHERARVTWEKLVGNLNLEHYLGVCILQESELDSCSLISILETNDRSGHGKKTSEMVGGGQDRAEGNETFLDTEAEYSGIS